MICLATSYLIPKMEDKRIGTCCSQQCGPMRLLQGDPLASIQKWMNNTTPVHRLCAIYTPETYFKLDAATGKEIVANIEGIPKARLELKCMFCRQKKGSCFQCSAKKCVRAYHATCAAAAGVEVNMVEVTVVGKDGENYQHTNIDYRCKVHRSKRPKDWDIERLENDPQIRNYCTVLQRNDIIQMQYLGGEIFAGFVLENRKNEEMVLVQILPRRHVFSSIPAPPTWLTVLQGYNGD
jgi:hypothetical protein